ncbi:MAG: hypothetical protein FWG98_14585, partial [Candidatus Cloacimonetes bacterium]|nr:hypothetical protein [Candidatus Cloacimonadota bacterium]
MKNQIKPIFTSFVMIISFITNISAAWIEREPIQLVQPNGDRVSAFISGDEFHNWIHDAEGFTIVKDNITSQYCWAIIENDELVSSGYPINQYMARNLCLEPYLNISDEAYREKRREWDEDFQNYRSSTPKTGEAHNIVIFITFPWGANYDPRIHGDAVFNNPFSVYENNFLDLNTYFWDASYQQLDVSSSFYPIQHGSNVVSHEADKERYYYTLEGAGYDLSIQIDRFNNLLKEAVSKIENMVPVGLNIDRNNDGIVDNVIFIIEGRIQSGSFWPSWGFFSGQPTLTIHDKVVRNYNIIIESSHTSDNDYANFRFIHILHEFAHSIGANDLYNRSTPDWRFDPVGPWCIMARSRDIVSSISSIVKYRDLGWIDIPTITTSGNYTLHPLSLQENNIVYRINSPYSENQYFIVEYRRKVASKFPDSNLLFRYDQISIQDPHGLIVYRIAGGSSVTGQYGVYIYHPHEVDKLYGVLNAFFSADSGRTAINDNTNPSSDIYLHGATLTKGGLDISNIGIAGDTISFDVTIPDLTQPVYVDPVNFDLCPYTYETIQEAINEVYNHGTVIIYPHPDGAYTGIGNKELSWVEDKKINIVGIDSVVIDCEEDDFFITSNNDNLISINNIKIINVKRALAFYGFSEIIVENVIMENYSINGIYANSANGANELLIINCQFLGTSVSNYQSRAIDVAVDKLTIKNSIFQDNSGAYGSSINYHGYKLHLEGNTFQNNITTSSRATIYVD